jgi:septin family protein
MRDDCSGATVTSNVADSFGNLCGIMLELLTSTERTNVRALVDLHVDASDFVDDNFPFSGSNVRLSIIRAAGGGDNCSNTRCYRVIRLRVTIERQ